MNLESGRCQPGLEVATFKHMVEVASHVRIAGPARKYYMLIFKAYKTHISRNQKKYLHTVNGHRFVFTKFEN
jgi:hypothetical protein